MCIWKVILKYQLKMCSGDNSICKRHLVQSLGQPGIVRIAYSGVVDAGPPGPGGLQVYQYVHTIPSHHLAIPDTVLKNFLWLHRGIHALACLMYSMSKMTNHGRIK